jgi:hypothetical protein
MSLVVPHQADAYLDFLQQTVLPLVQKSYRVRTTRLNLSILGSSLGGLVSCYAAYRRPFVWSRAGCMSSSFWWNGQDFNGTIMNRFPCVDCESLPVDSIRFDSVRFNSMTPSFCWKRLCAVRRQIPRSILIPAIPAT